MYNRLDIAEAYYFYLSENHEGQFSEKYRRLSKLLKWFKPSPTFNRDRLSENAQIILENLENV